MSLQIMTMKTKSLFIREWNIQDAPQFLPLSRDPGLNAGPRPSFNQENATATEKKIIEWALTFGQTKMGLLPIFLADGKTLVGIGGIKPRMLEKASMQFEVICQMSEAHQEFLSEGVQALVHYGFKSLGLKELIHLSTPDDKNSRLALEKAGLHFLKSIQLKQTAVDVFHVTAQ